MVALSVIDSATALLSLQRAAEIDPTNLTIYSAACSGNCTETCQKAYEVWRSIETLHNCLAYPHVSKLLSTGNLDPNSAQIAYENGYLGNFTLPNDPIDQCVATLCQDGCYHEDPLLLRLQDQFSRPWVISPRLPLSFLTSACSFETSPNTDVGGIGIFIGYLMQLAMLIYTYVHTRGFSAWIRNLVFLAYLPVRGPKEARSRARAIQEMLDNTCQQAAVTTGLIEFQKTQAFFTYVLEGAALVALLGDGSLLDVSSVKQLHLTVDLLRDVATMGLLSLTFGLYILQAGGKRSRYITALSTLAFLNCLAAWIVSCTSLDNLIKIKPTMGVGPAQCGHFLPGAFYETRIGPRLLIFAFEGVLVAVAALSLLGMILRLSDLPWTRKCTWRWRSELAELVFAIMAAGMLFVFTSNGEMKAMQSNARWTLAQLLAVTIWVPSIMEYWYAASRGIVKMMDHRLAPGFGVMEVKDEDDPD